jgi:hypothetical protein
MLHTMVANEIYGLDRPQAIQVKKDTVLLGQIFCSLAYSTPEKLISIAVVIHDVLLL